MRGALTCCLLFLLCWPAPARAQSPYAGEETRDIKSLSPQEISDYLSGKGMGLAKAAELNGYPGPAHVLELAEELKLTGEQKATTEALFERMQARAISLGKELIEAEHALDRLFASRTVTKESLQRSLARIAALQGRVRQAHLEAHLEQIALLTPDQIKDYNRLRGYGHSPAAQGPGHRRH